MGDKEVEIRLELKEGKYQDKKNFRKNNLGDDDIRNKNFGVEIGLMSLEKLQKVCDMYNNFCDVSAQNYSLDIKNVKAENKDKVLLIPLQYNGCWSAEVNGKNAEVNGKNAEVRSVMSLLTAVELNGESNNISMKFIPTGFKTGMIISVVSAVLFAVVLILRRKERLAPKALCSFVYVLYSLAFCVAGVAIYIIPFAFLIYHKLF